MAQEVVKGMDKVQKALESLPLNIQKRALNSSIRAGGREVVKQARKELRKSNKTMNLSKSIGVKVLKPKGFTILSIVGPRVGKGQRYDGWYAHLVEYGTQPHKITPKKQNLENALNTNLYGFKGSVDHPGAKAKPFMRPAFDKSKKKSVDAFGKKLWERTKIEVIRLNKR